MEPTKELVDDIYRRRVLRARETPPDEKLLDGARLFDYACWIMACGVRDQYPDADEERVNQLVADRLALGRRLEGR